MTSNRPDHSTESFADVLRRVGNPSAEAAPAADAGDRAPRVAYRFAMLPDGGDEPGLGNASMFDAALDWVRGEEAPAARPVPAPQADRPLPGCDERAVAAELGLTADLTPADLRRIRRAFALKNHPDRLQPSRRGNATLRMTVANALIDRAIKSRRAGR